MPDDTTPAAPYQQPTSPPPGGGNWTWDTATGEWVIQDPAPSTIDPQIQE